MEKEQTLSSKWTSETIVDLIRKVRNDLIKDFLDERYLKEYLTSKFGLREIHPLKTELVKLNLKELLISPVDTTHYKVIIDQIQTTDTASLSEGNEKLFYHEIDQILKKHVF